MANNITKFIVIKKEAEKKINLTDFYARHT
jgi:hypothetical protein